MSEFIPFHRELTKGEKRSLSRATRFIYLELALAARASNGVLRLPRNHDVVDAVHDELGGNRREITEAMRELQKPFRDGDDPMIRVAKHADDSYDVVVVAWEDWKLSRDTGAERQRRMRERRKHEREDRNALITSRSHVPLTSPSRDGVTDRNGLEERRVEESKGDPPEGAARQRSNKKSKGERPDQQVWRLFRQAYERSRGRKYVSDPTRDGGAAKRISAEADAHASTVDDREALITFWCTSFFDLDDEWLETNAFPMHALARALPQIGTPSADTQTSATTDAPPDDGEERGPHLLKAEDRAKLEELSKKSGMPLLPGADVRWAPKPKEAT